jgi:HlyD family secretion protein
MSKRTRFIIVAVLAFLGCLGVWMFFIRGDAADSMAYRLAPVERGPIVSAVSTSGTLNAMITVQVGSQVSGQIKELLADYNSEVKADQVIARIDPQTFEARTRQAQAELEVARANVVIQRAGIERARKELANAAAALNSAMAQTEKAQVTLENSRRNLERRKALFKSGAVSESQTDDAQTAHDQALAQLKGAQADERAAASLVASREAALKTAMAQVEYALEQVRQKEAALSQAEVDLSNTYIRSPVDGVVIERAVDIGQTVAASFQAPKLFTIAQDLRQMQVEADVDEADIGRVHVGQNAVFTVDAFPGREFSGRVLQIRKAPRLVQNVVTYTVVVSAENSDLRLLPGMTANIQIIVDERQDALKIPNAALRFRPNGEEPKRPGAAAETRGGGNGRGDAVPPEERIRQLTGLLQLTESQQNQVRAIFSESREKIAAMRRQGASAEEIRKEAAALKESGRKAVSGLLTPAQKERYAQWIAAQESSPVSQGRVYLLGEKNRPVPVEVTLGISDGTFTEMARGDLNPGQSVIIGSGASNQKAAPRPRFGF